MDKQDQDEKHYASLNYVPLELWPEPEELPIRKGILRYLQDAYREAIHEYVIPVVPILIAEAIIYLPAFFILKTIFSLL